MQIVVVCNTLLSQQGAPVNRHHHHRRQGHKAVIAVVCQSVPLISTQSNNTALEVSLSRKCKA